MERGWVGGAQNPPAAPTRRAPTNGENKSVALGDAHAQTSNIFQLQTWHGMGGVRKNNTNAEMKNRHKERGPPPPPV
jgi:hypothetical protein